MVPGASNDVDVSRTESATPTSSRLSLLDRVRHLYIQRGVIIMIGAFVIILLYGLITGSLKFYPDLEVTSLQLGAADAPTELTCRTRDQEDLTAYIRIERTGAFPRDAIGSNIRLMLSADSGGSSNTHTFSQPLAYGRPVSKSTEASVVRVNAMRIRLPPHLRGGSLAWTVTVFHPDDRNRTNDTLTGTLPMC